jgi:hypothetical protein
MNAAKELRNKIKTIKAKDKGKQGKFLASIYIRPGLYYTFSVNAKKSVSDVLTTASNAKVKYDVKKEDKPKPTIKEVKKNG